MNTSLKITQLTNSKARYRANEILRLIPNLRFDADIEIIKNEAIEAKFLNKNQKAQRVQLQKNLHIYKKRLAKAIEQNKQKSILTNTKKIEEIKEKLEAQQVPKGRKKNFLEISFQLTNTHIDPAKFDNYDIFYEFVKSNRFTKELDLKVAAYHKDQHSPHLHCLFDITDIDNFAGYLRSKLNYKINDTREIYSIMQNDFHDFVSKYYELNKMQKCQKYMSINKYKIFTVKIQNIKNFVEKMKRIFEKREYKMFEKETEKMYEDFLNEQIHQKQEKIDFNTNHEQIVEKQEKIDSRAISDCSHDSFTNTASTTTRKKHRNR